MSIREDIELQYKKSIKEKNVETTNALRLIKSAIKDKDISSRSKNNQSQISDQEILILLQSLIKQRNDSIESFKNADRQDLIEKEENEIKIIKVFLPNQKSEEEIINIIDQIILENNFKSIKDMGKLIGMIKNKFSGEVDMAIVGKIAKTKLTV